MYKNIKNGKIYLYFIDFVSIIIIICMVLFCK